MESTAKESVSPTAFPVLLPQAISKQAAMAQNIVFFIIAKDAFDIGFSSHTVIIDKLHEFGVVRKGPGNPQA